MKQRERPRVAMNVRLPAELHEALARIASAEDRSMNAQIVRFLREAINRYEATETDEERRDRR